MTLHNPDNLTPEQVGEGWRLLTKDEITKPLPNDAEYWYEGGWDWSDQRGKVAALVDQKKTTYRTRITVSPLVSRIAAEIAEKQALLEILPAIEAGAEWEVMANNATAPWNDWVKPDEKVEWYLSKDRIAKWHIRLKPAPEPAPFWDCAADVPLNCRLAVKGAAKGRQQYGIGYINEIGIGVNGPSGFNTFEWAGIEFIEYTLDGVTFHPCRKGGPR